MTIRLIRVHLRADYLLEVYSEFKAWLSEVTLEWKDNQSAQLVRAVVNCEG